MHGNDAGLRHRRSKHYELGRHGALKAWAEELDLQEAADLLGETLAEEKRTDLLLVKLAEQRGKLRGTLPSVLLALRGSKASTSASAASEFASDQLIPRETPLMIAIGEGQLAARIGLQPQAYSGSIQSDAEGTIWLRQGWITPRPAMRMRCGIQVYRDVVC